MIFFINIGPNQVSQIADSNTHFSTYLSKSTDNTMFFNPITEDEVLEVSKNLDVKKSTGHDGFSILKGHWTSSTSSPNFFQKKLGFLYH